MYIYIFIYIYCTSLMLNVCQCKMFSNVSLILSFKYVVTTNSCRKCVRFQVRAIRTTQRKIFVVVPTIVPSGGLKKCGVTWRDVFLSFALTQILVNVFKGTVRIIERIRYLYLICPEYYELTSPFSFQQLKIH